MTTSFPAHFAQQYDSHLKHLKLKGLQPKTIDAYARAIRRLGEYFDYRIDDLSEAQLTEYFSDLIGTHSWSNSGSDTVLICKLRTIKSGSGLAIQHFNAASPLKTHIISYGFSVTKCRFTRKNGLAFGSARFFAGCV